MATSGRSAGTATSCSPVNGQVIGATVRVRHQVGADVAAHHRARQIRGAGRVPVGHPGVAVLLDLDRPWPVVLDRVAEAMQRADAGVAAVGEHQPARRAHPDHLVVEEVRRHPDQLELAPALAQISCPAANGIRCVNPSSATESPSLTRDSTASLNDINSATTEPFRPAGLDAARGRPGSACGRTHVAPTARHD